MMSLKFPSDSQTLAVEQLLATVITYHSIRIIGVSGTKASSKEQQKRNRDKVFINNGGTVLGHQSHQLPLAMMLPYQ